MMTEKVQQVLQQIESLSADEKQSLVDYLNEQAQKDVSVRSVPSSHQDVTPEEPEELDPYRRREYEWLKEHRDEYAGQYVALYSDQLVAHGTDGRTVLRQAREAGFPRALMVRIESPDELPFGGW